MKKTPKSTVAKHVFGELALKDILPMVAECDSVTVETLDGDDALDGEELVQAPLKITKHGINVFRNKEDLEEDESLLLLFPENKVAVDSAHVEYRGRMFHLRLTFFKDGKPFVFNIL